MVPIRSRARVRRFARRLRKRVSKLFPVSTERELFGPWVRYLEQRYVERSHGLGSGRGGRERAARLLAGHLNSPQRRCLRRRGFFMVVGKSGRRFRVWARRELSVELVNPADSQHVQKPWCYCIHNGVTEDGALLPLADYLLELKLCLEADEEYFLLTSNPDFTQGVIEKNELLRRAYASTGMQDAPSNWLRACIYFEEDNRRAG